MDTLAEKIYEIEQITDRDYGCELHETVKKTHKFNNKLQFGCIFCFLIFAFLITSPLFLKIDSVSPRTIKTIASTALMASVIFECFSSYKTMIKLIGAFFGLGLKIEYVPIDIVCGTLLAFLCTVIFVLIPPLSTIINSKREKLLLKYTKQFCELND